MTNTTKINATNFLGQDLLQCLPQEYQNGLKTLVNTLSKEIINKGRRINYAKKKKKRLKNKTTHSQSTHGKTRSSLFTRLKEAKDHLEYLQNTLHHSLQNAFNLNIIKTLLKKHQIAYDYVFNKINKIVIKQQNYINRQIDNTDEMIKNVTFEGVLKYWSERDYDAINRVVMCVLKIRMQTTKVHNIFILINIVISTTTDYHRCKWTIPIWPNSTIGQST